MEITIIGWYGTETIGDRAILAGIFRILSETFGFYSVRLGSLFPFYTQRTLLEDNDFYKIASQNTNLCIKLFDTRNPFELRHNITHSDLLLVGGGPLMDLQEMSMLEFAFNTASRYKIKCAVLGCGWGPLKTEKAKSIARKLVDESNLVIFRDNISKEQAIKCGCDPQKISTIIDPAFIACSIYLDNPSFRTNDYVCINFRDVALEGNNYLDKAISLDFFTTFVSDILSNFKLPIHLVPMHNFFIGGDDRIILTKIAQTIVSDNVTVIQKPLSLKQTMDEFYNAAFCVGMRFHSVVLQTVLNGRNFIVDYTDSQSGKIIGMMKSLGIDNEYKNQYISLCSLDSKFKINLNTIKKYSIPKIQLQQYLNDYCNLTKLLIK